MNSRSRDPSVIYVGRKPPMNYVLGIITSFGRSNTKTVTLKARGQAITTAVDAAEIVRHRFMRNLNVDKITIGTEEIQQEEGGTRNVSTMEITLTRAPSTKKEAKKESKKKKSTPPKPSPELTSIEGIGAKSAEKLKSCGVNSARDLANADPKELSDKLKTSEKRVSKWIDEAKKALKH
ncbi:MAG: DNA-binding protein Alba [Candidatus Bathyarchaeota archaeon]|nr:MAG: DNA-binding protein Alba [Candidatus Bathyarchaeota archaeon]